MSEQQMDIAQLMNLITHSKAKQDDLSRLASTQVVNQPVKRPDQSMYQFLTGKGNDQAQARGLNQFYGAILNRDRTKQTGAAAASDGFERGHQLIDQIRGAEKGERMAGAQQAASAAQQELKNSGELYGLQQGDAQRQSTYDASMARTNATTENARLGRESAEGIAAANRTSSENIAGMVNGQEKAVEYLDEKGKIVREGFATFDPRARSWVDESGNPLSAGQFRAAPTRTNTATKNDDLWVTPRVEAFQEQRGVAEEAVGTLNNANDALKILDEGMITGSFANVQVSIAKLAKTAGLVDATAPAAVAAETYVAFRAKEVAAKIKAFGSGTGLSDKDREYAEKMAAGTITMSEEAMRKILEMDQTMASNLIDGYMTDHARFSELGMLPEAMSDLYAVEKPPAYFSTGGKPTATNAQTGETIYEHNGNWVNADGTPYQGGK